MSFEFAVEPPDRGPELGAEWVEPGCGEGLWIASPNRDERPGGIDTVDLVVLHATVVPTLEATIRRFCDPASKVSAHFTIGRGGGFVQSVATARRAWHAGPSRDLRGRERLNDVSIGIELVNLNDGRDPYPEPQIEALRGLLVALAGSHPLRFLASHASVARPPGRKTDPAGFPWARLGDLGLRIEP